MKKIPNYKLQAIVDNNQPWPFIGNAFTCANGAIRILLDRGVKIELADGTKIEGAKLYLRQPARRTETVGPDALADASQPIADDVTPVGITTDAAQSVNGGVLPKQSPL